MRLFGFSAHRTSFQEKLNEKLSHVFAKFTAWFVLVNSPRDISMAMASQKGLRIPTHCFCEFIKCCPRRNFTAILANSA